MPNHLIDQTSPYLLQHAHNPVDWYPWGADALEKARQENKPIFLSIGYAACHWCHVMAHESFEDPDTARLMNENFINIKVDREERPDIDSIYMSAVTAMTGSGGWPMSVFLTPDGRPFYGGTYFPSSRRYGMPSFKEVLVSIARTWKENKGEVERVAGQLAAHLQEANRLNLDLGRSIDPDTLERAADKLIQTFDRKTVAWGQAPLFPQPMTIEFLLQQATRGNEPALETASAALRAMNRGGMYDVVGGGFHRYSTDARWLVPHFEKMLYDNAQLALTYLHGYLLTGELSFRRTCVETLDFVQREMTNPLGGFYSSLDADSEGEEGKYYVWTIDELRAAIDDPALFDLFSQAYNLQPNFEGEQIVLQRRLPDDELAKELNLSLDDLHQALDRAHHKLFTARQARVRPGTDDKVLVAWNAMELQAFAEAARYLRRGDYLEIARKNADFLLGNLREGGRLLRAWREGQARHEGYLEDYAALIIALLALYQSDPDPHWYSEAVRLAEEMVAGYQDENGGFYDARDTGGKLVVRPKDVQDNATPSGNALAALALLQLSEYAERGDWRDRAEHMAAGLQEIVLQYPTAFAYWLQGIDFAVGPVQQIAIVYPKADESLIRMVDYLWQTYRPRTVAALSQFPPPDGSPELLHDRPLRGSAPTVYICQGFTCNLPVNTLEGLEQQLPATTRPV